MKLVDHDNAMPLNAPQPARKNAAEALLRKFYDGLHVPPDSLFWRFGQEFEQVRQEQLEALATRIEAIAALAYMKGDALLSIEGFEEQELRAPRRYTDRIKEGMKS